MKAARILILISMIAVIAFSGVAVSLAQEATPAEDASPVAECIAPELPPGTPTPLDDEASPEAVEESSEPASEEDTAGTAEEMAPAESPADDATAAAAREGLNAILDCIAAGDYLGLAALMTSNGVAFVTGTGNPYDVPLSMEGSMPVEIVEEGEAVSDDSGRVGLHLVYRGLFNGPGALSSERWYLVQDDGTWKLDGIANVPAPEGFMPEATIVTIDAVDFAFAVSQNEVPAGPVIFRVTNTSYTHSSHVAVIVTLVEGITAEEVIQMDALPDDQLTGFFGATFLEAGQTADLIFESLEPGVYTIVCDVETPSGVEHWKLGMVAQFDVV